VHQIRHFAKFVAPCPCSQGRQGSAPVWKGAARQMRAPLSALALVLLQAAQVASIPPPRPPSVSVAVRSHVVRVCAAHHDYQVVVSTGGLTWLLARAVPIVACVVVFGVRRCMRLTRAGEWHYNTGAGRAHS